MTRNGADLICSELIELGVQCVFGLPGTQNVRLYEAMRASDLRRVVPVDEGAAAFMAGAYARASGAVAVLTTIPGPGFVYALPGIVEARHDSAPILWITLRQPDLGRAFQLQRIDQAAMAAPAVKQSYFVDRPEQLAPTLRAAHACAIAGEPGPVLLEVDAVLLEQLAVSAAPEPIRAAAVADIAPLVAALGASRFPVLYVGQGAQGAAEQVRMLAHRLNVPVLCTSSGRGVVPDDDPLVFVQDFSTGLGGVVPSLIERSDLVLALGCKFTHNGSAGGRLALPSAKLVRVDACEQVLAANYPASLAVAASVESVLAALSGAVLPASQWPADEIAGMRLTLQAETAAPIPLEPILPDATTPSIGALFEALAAADDGRSIYVTDAGLHQALTRRYARVRRARGLLCPSDFQSMGFGLPGAIGAAIAVPESRVVACLGDAALALSLGDLMTAVREGVDLVIVVFNDGQMNLIRRQQIANYGQESGVAVANPDFAALAQAVGCSYFPASGDLHALARDVFAARGVRLVELRLADVPSLEWQRLRSVVREGVRARLPEGAVQSVRRLLGR